MSSLLDSFSQPTDWFGAGFDDNAGVSPDNAQNTSPLITSGNSSNVSPGWLSFLQTAIGTAGTAYGATVTADANIRNGQAAQAAKTNSGKLLVYLAIAGAVILGAVLLLRRK